MRNRRLRERRGSRPPPSEAERSAGAERRRSAAHEELFDLRIDPRASYVRVLVANPVHGTRYRVHLPEAPRFDSATCECADFSMRQIGTCKHLEAVRLWAAEHPEVLRSPEPPRRSLAARRRWGEVDDLEAARARDPRPASLRWRGPGAALLEPWPPSGT